MNRREHSHSTNVNWLRFRPEPVRGAENVGSRIYSERIFPQFSPLTKISLICKLVAF